MLCHERICDSETPSVAVVIGTYGSPCYVHLGLELLKRNVGKIPVLVHDDASFETVPAEHEQLRRVCVEYGADFSTNSHSYGHMQGDFSVFIAGWKWAAARHVDYLVKFSRRFIPMVNWLPELQTLAYITQYATFSNSDSCHSLGFRSECVAMHVNSWLGAGIVQEAEQLMAANHDWYIEVITHNFSRSVHRRNCRANQLYERVHPPAEPDLGYGRWPFMGSSRCTRMPGYLWRDAVSPAEYFRVATDSGIRMYPEAAFANLKEH